MAFPKELGPLESRLLRLLWERGDATVRELIDECDLDMAYTTAMTTLDRLHKKGLLTRRVEGRAFRYTPSVTQSELHVNSIRAAISRLFHVEREPRVPISFLVDAVSEHDVRLLDQLEEAIERKRRELNAPEEEQ